jgi:HSP20 family protein
MSHFRQHPLVALREEMDDLVSRVFGGEEGWLSGALAPALDMSETDTGIQVSVDLPGINPDEVDIHLAGNVLTMRGERPAESEDPDRTFHRMETRRGKFSRTLTLPCAVVEDEVGAEYKAGVLTITLPKCQEARSRKISVRH